MSNEVYLSSCHIISRMYLITTPLLCLRFLAMNIKCPKHCINVIFQCRENVDGRRCDRCEENTYDKQAGCIGQFYWFVQRHSEIWKFREY